MQTFKTDPIIRVESRIRARLRKLGFKLVKRQGGYGILVYSEAVDAWTEAEGMAPIPYSLSLDTVIELTSEYMAEAEIEKLQEVPRLSVVA